MATIVRKSPRGASVVATMPKAVGRRAILAGLAGGAARGTFGLGCGRPPSARPRDGEPRAAGELRDAADAGATSDAGATREAGEARTTSDAEEGDASTAARSRYALFEAHPALASALPRVELGFFPSAIEPMRAVRGDVYVVRDDDFSRAPGCPGDATLPRAFGGGKVRKLELYLGEARALGKKRLVTTGGVGSNQAVAAAILGRALGFEVGLYLAPQPRSSLTAKNLAADAAAHAELRLFSTVHEAHEQATREARVRGDTYVVPPGGTTPLGTLGFVSAGLELAARVRARDVPAPARVYVALGLGGSAAGLAMGCALGGLETEIVAVRASSPGTVTAATLRRVHDETIAFLRARDRTVPSLVPSDVQVRIDGRFVGDGYGVPTRAGDGAIERARRDGGLELDPVYTGKAFAALLADVAADARGPILFWNTMSSRALAPVASGASVDVPPPFARFTR